jgi:glycosyltransferase involved in cell wall biosynthesis
MMNKGLLPKVQIYILSYNRPEYVAQSLKSVLNQDYANFEVVISDNSTSDDVEKLLSPLVSETPTRYVRRKPSLSAMNHFNLILSEVTADYFVLFHDDDLLLSNSVSTAVQTMIENETAAAVGTNAYVIEGQKETKLLFNPQLSQTLTVNTVDRLILHYILSDTGHVPFPSYLYRTKYVQGVRMNFKQGGKHFDVSFLLKLIHQGNIIWLKDPLMFYRRHLGNDSLKIDLRAILSLCRFMSRQISPENKWIVEDFKKKHYLLWFYQRLIGISKPLDGIKDRVITKTALFYLLTHPKLIFRFLLKRVSPGRFFN